MKFPRCDTISQIDPDGVAPGMRLRLCDWFTALVSADKQETSGAEKHRGVPSPSPACAALSHMATAFTSPRLPSGRLRPSSTGYGEVDRAKRGRVRGPLRESEPVERPPHPIPLPASGEREQPAAPHAIA